MAKNPGSGKVADRILEAVPATGAAPARRPLSPIRGQTPSRALPHGAVVLGIDPGTATMGWGVIRVGGAGRRRGGIGYVQHGAITTPPEWPMPRRLNRLFEGVGAIIEGYGPSAIAVEELFFGRNVSTAITVGQARGTVLLAAHRAGLPVHEYKPSQVKQAVTSYGAADKRQVQEMVRALLDLREIPRPDDAADGLAIALTHAFTSGHSSATAR